MGWPPRQRARARGPVCSRPAGVRVCGLFVGPLRRAGVGGWFWSGRVSPVFVVALVGTGAEGATALVFPGPCPRLRVSVV